MYRIERERQEREDLVTRKHRERQEDKERGAAAFYAMLDRLPGAERDVAVIRRVVERLVAGGYCGVVSDMLLALPYREYLETNHWNEVRMRAMKRAEFRCMLCNSEGELHTHFSQFYQHHSPPMEINLFDSPAIHDPSNRHGEMCLAGEESATWFVSPRPGRSQALAS